MRWLAALPALLASALAVAQAPDPAWTVPTLDPADLVIAQRYTAPYRGFFCVRRAGRSGALTGWREVPSWANQASGRAVLSPPDVTWLSSELARLQPRTDPPPRSGMYVTLTYRRGGRVGHGAWAEPLPPPVRAIVQRIEDAWTRTSIEHGCGSVR